jgi:hypothetical protein
MNKRILGSIAALGLLVASAASAQGVKWHPGHYVMLPGGGSMSAHLSQIEEIGDEPAIKGVMVRLWWHELETGWGRYDFSRINTYLWKLKQQPTRKQLVIRIMDREFQTNSAGGIVPDYLRTNWRFNGGVVRTNTGYAARLWEAPVMSRLIALYQAIGRRFDDDAYFEGLFTEESTLSLRSPFPSGYSHAALTQQYMRFVDQVKPAMPRSNLFMNANWIGSSSLMSDLIQQLSESHVAAGSSNITPGSKTLGQRVVTGDFGANYRWDLPIANGVETAELGGRLGDYTPWQIGNWAYNELHSHYVFWTRNTWSGDSGQRWHTGILPYLRSDPPFRANCPNTYGWCIRN